MQMLWGFDSYKLARLAIEPVQNFHILTYMPSLRHVEGILFKSCIFCSKLNRIYFVKWDNAIQKYPACVCYIDKTVSATLGSASEPLTSRTNSLRRKSKIPTPDI